MQAEILKAQSEKDRMIKILEEKLKGQQSQAVLNADLQQAMVQSERQHMVEKEVAQTKQIQMLRAALQDKEAELERAHGLAVPIGDSPIRDSSPGGLPTPCPKCPQMRLEIEEARSKEQTSTQSVAQVQQIAKQQ